MHHWQQSGTVSFATFVTMVLAAAPATAQCAPQFLAGMGIPGVLGDVMATTMWDRDGAGPLPPLLVIGGAFTEVGTLRTNNIAAYDPATGDWSALGSGVDGSVSALAVAQNGDLIAGGYFSVAGSVGANRVARWDGTAWSALGSGFGGATPFTGSVYALAVKPNGDIVAGGFFTTASGSPANNIAQWDGVSWSPLGAGTGGPQYWQRYVIALTVLPNGDLIAGGSFTTAGGIAAPCVARWNGSNWSPMITTITSITGVLPEVVGFAQMPNGDVVAAGWFASINGVATANIARWNGTSWSPLGAGTNSGIWPLALLPNGDLVVGGYFSQAGGVPALRMARWDGGAWSPFGSGANDTVSSFALLPSGEIFAGGLFSVIGGVPAARVGRWNGAGWSALNAGQAGLGGVDAHVLATFVMPNGDLIAAGPFSMIGGVAAPGIARWNGTTWSPLGGRPPGISLFYGQFALAAMPNGDVVVGGSSSVVRWDGTSWSTLPSPGIFVARLAVLANGDLVAAAGFSFSTGVLVTRWNGSTWTPMGSASGFVNALVPFPNGDLLIAGLFTTVDGVPVSHIARWNGVTWSALGSGVSDEVKAVAVMPDGSVAAAGIFHSAGGTHGPRARTLERARMVGARLGACAYIGNPQLLPLPNGDLLLGGAFSSVGGVPATRLARWDGAAWSAFGSGCDGNVRGLAAMTNGDVVVNGEFLTAGGVVSARIARVSTTCPATVVSIGAGCTGSGGPNVLTATTLPWTGSTFRAVATGMPAQALVLSVYGFTPVSIPIASVLPQGLPGCDIHMLPDFIDVLLPAAGAVQTQLAVPDDVALAGLVLHHFVVPFEVDATLQVLAITSSNALTLTMGSF
jgi:hypothetical protein